MSTMWWVYLLECSDGSYYAGVAVDVERRLAQHNAGRGAKYTRGRTPATLIASQGPMDRSAALRLEAKVKRQKRPEKPAMLARADHAG